MALLFSAVTLTGDDNQVELLVPGIPKESNDLRGWTAYENFIASIDHSTQRSKKPIRKKYTGGSIRKVTHSIGDIRSRFRMWWSQTRVLSSATASASIRSPLTSPRRRSRKTLCGWCMWNPEKSPTPPRFSTPCRQSRKRWAVSLNPSTMRMTQFLWGMKNRNS